MHPLTTNDWKQWEPGRRAAATMFVAAAFALCAGLYRSAVAVILWSLTNRINFFSRDIVWMAPLGTLLVFTPPALLLAAAAAAAPRWVSLRSVVFILGAPAALSVMLLFGQIHDAASLLLSIGVAWRFADVVSGRPDGTVRAAQRLALGAAALVAVFGGWRLSWPISERRAIARKPPAASGAPNVLIIVLDAVRAADLSVYGYHRATTPGLERWARDGTVFDWAMAPSSWTMPSHEALFTGRFPGELSGSFHFGLDASYPTLAEVLNAHGYRTGGFAANPYYTTRESGLARGFDHYDATHPSLLEILLSATLMQTRVVRELAAARNADDVIAALTPPRLYLNPNLTHDPAPADVPVGRFLGWQAGIRERPFFAFLNLFDAHAPYHSAPDPWPTKFSARPGPRDRYDGAIAWEDAQVDSLLRTLARRGVLDRTLVIVTADHGEQFGEHGLNFHGNSLYMALLHVPLLMRYPGHVPAGQRMSRPVGVRRLAATALDLAGITDPAIPGQSLAEAWRQPESDTASVRVQMQSSEDLTPGAPHGPLRAVISTRWHYIRQADGLELLFDYRTDPLERRNMAGTPAGDSALPSLRERAATMPAQP